MLIINLVVGCVGLVLSGHALARYVDARDVRWAIAGIVEVLIGMYFVIAALGVANS